MKNQTHATLIIRSSLALALALTHTDGWMGGRAGGEMWVWTVVGILVVVLPVALISKRSKNNPARGAPGH